MKKLICLLFCCLLFLPAAAQWKWHNPMEAGFPVIQNQGFTKEIGNSYTRLPERAKGVVSEPVAAFGRTRYSFLQQCPADQSALHRYR